MGIFQTAGIIANPDITLTFGCGTKRRSFAEVDGFSVRNPTLSSALRI
jgi:hypothetical protein